MHDLDDSFSKLLGRQPSDLQKQRLYQTKDALGLKNNDALWLVLIALEHYNTLYEDIPNRIENAARSSLDSLEGLAKMRLEAASSAAIDSIKYELVEKVAGLSEQTIVRDKWWWSFSCVALSLSALIVVGVLSFNFGERVGKSEAYQEVRDEQAAASWANSGEGKKAFSMAQKGTLSLLINCGGKGWKVENNNCIPYTSDNTVTGWLLP
jgi:hypothetical protein